MVLVGMMGSGKSSVGRALSERTGWPFVDNDSLVERASGMTARQLLEQRGADAMRQAESAALRAGVEIDPPAVVATAAGTILDAANRSTLAHAGLVIWLRAPAETLAARAVGAAHRPWLEDDPVGWFERALAERDPLYAAVADLEVDTAALSPERAADQILAWLSAGG
ncbi:MAG TPA: shikimate kinase [Candidatus Limnocylindria bacterium]